MLMSKQTQRLNSALYTELWHVVQSWYLNGCSWGPKDDVDRRILQAMVYGNPLSWALEPECMILMLMWSLGPQFFDGSNFFLGADIRLTAGRKLQRAASVESAGGLGLKAEVDS